MKRRLKRNSSWSAQRTSATNRAKLLVDLPERSGVGKEGREYEPVADSPKKFHMLSVTEGIVGDAKYLSLVRGEDLSPAKFMEIAGHVWLLERVWTAPGVFSCWVTNAEFLNGGWKSTDGSSRQWNSTFSPMTETCII